jgi:hypothetical protein
MGLVYADMELVRTADLILVQEGVIAEEKVRNVKLGAIALEDMDGFIDPKRQELIVNPAHPYIAQKHLKHIRAKRVTSLDVCASLILQ